MYKAQLGDLIEMSLEGRCSESRFVSAARYINKVHNVVEIIMNETCSKDIGKASPNSTNCTRAYSGLAVHYTEIDNPDGGDNYKDLIDSSSTMDNFSNTKGKTAESEKP